MASGYELHDILDGIKKLEMVEIVLDKYLIEELIDKSKISASEMEKLKTKEYTKSLFKATDYPAVANNRTDNRGILLICDIELKSYILMGWIFTISTQFFESDREAVIEWYKEHLS